MTNEVHRTKNMIWFRVTYTTSELNRIMGETQRVQKEVMVLVVGGRVAASSPNGNIGKEWKDLCEELRKHSEAYSADLKIEALPDAELE